MSKENSKQYFRNTVDITSIEGILVDAFSLWKKTSDNLLELVDQDQYVTAHPSDAFQLQEE